MDVPVSAFVFSEGKLAIFDQYPGVLHRLNRLRQDSGSYPPKGLLLTGSPGIGKTSCLWYLLMTSISLSQTVIIHYDDSVHVFTEKGVYSIMDPNIITQVIRNRQLQGVFCLVDMDLKETDLRRKLLARESSCFTVAASSPRAERYKDWVKQCRIATFILDALTNRDFFTMATLNSNIDVGRFAKRLSILLAVYGPSLRLILPICNEEQDTFQGLLEIHLTSIQDHVRSLASSRSLDKLFTSPDTLTEEFSHSLVHTYGREGGQLHSQEVRHRIRSPLVLRIILQLIQTNKLRELRDIYELFRSSSYLAVSRGWAFEILAHERICSMTTLSLYPVAAQGLYLKKVTNGTPITVTIGQRSLHIFTRLSRLETTTRIDRYYVPAEGNNPTFDAFPQGTTMVRRRLRASDPNRDWETNKMKFVFVVPLGTEFQVEAPKTALKDLEFWSLELDMANANYQKFDDFLGEEGEDKSEDEESEVEESEDKDLRMDDVDNMQ
ncbi:hypothetical protein B0H17DRAFT_1125876 [Mycena rosella]|uniref:Uncharacterized protein n=1 Tax=Mycena rosella TaxID=1033263 RepID=A0AAD7M8Q5_MYCRO|nr:hypothetical protein B0H17DRAFT_1125876 [Mycena rosella]